MIPEENCHYLRDKKRLDKLNKQQDENHEELKAMVEEVSHKQESLAEKQDELENTVNGLWHHLDNGWKQDMIQKTAQQNNRMMERMMKLVEQKNFMSFKLLMMMLGGSGIIALIITGVLKFLKQ